MEAVIPRDRENRITTHERCPSNSRKQKLKEVKMGYTQVALEDKILDMFPEIRKHGVSPRLSFDESKNAWVVKLVKGKQEYTIYLDKKDADACMDNTFCEAFNTDLCDVVKKFDKS
jgi:hypothetical protein